MPGTHQADGSRLDVRDWSGNRLRSPARWTASRDPGSDVGAADEVAVPSEPAMPAAEHAPGRLRDTSTAVRAGGGGAPLIDQHGHDPGLLSLAGQAADQVSDPPVPHPLVMPPARTHRQHPARVADLQRAHPMGQAPGHNLGRSFVLGLADPPPVRCFPVALAGKRLVPPPRPPHPARAGWRRTGGGGRSPWRAVSCRPDAAGFRRGSPAPTPPAQARPARPPQTGG